MINAHAAAADGALALHRISGKQFVFCVCLLFKYTEYVHYKKNIIYKGSSQPPLGDMTVVGLRSL